MDSSQTMDNFRAVSRFYKCNKYLNYANVLRKLCYFYFECFHFVLMVPYFLSVVQSTVIALFNFHCVKL